MKKFLNIIPTKRGMRLAQIILDVQGSRWPINTSVRLLGHSYRWPSARLAYEVILSCVPEEPCPTGICGFLNKAWKAWMVRVVHKPR